LAPATCVGLPSAAVGSGRSSSGSPPRRRSTRSPPPVPRSTARRERRRAARQSASKSHGGSSAVNRPSRTEKSQPRICAPVWARRRRSRSSPAPVTACPQSSAVLAVSPVAGCPLGPRGTITAQIHLHHVVVHTPFGAHELVVLVQDREHVHRAEPQLGPAPGVAQVHLQVPVVQTTIDELWVAVGVRLPGL